MCNQLLILHSTAISLSDVKLSDIPDDDDLITIATIAIANDDNVVLDAVKKLRHFRQVNSKLVKMQSWTGIVGRLWNTYKGRLQPLITIAINALRGHVGGILNRHPTVKRYVQQLLCGY